MVYEDMNNAMPTKIHYTACYHFKRHLQVGSITTKWHGPYNLDMALITAKRISNDYTTGWRKGGCCFR